MQPLPLGYNGRGRPDAIITRPSAGIAVAVTSPETETPLEEQQATGGDQRPLHLLPARANSETATIESSTPAAQKEYINIVTVITKPALALMLA